jgi:AcrR family transcriptional regulator
VRHKRRSHDPAAARAAILGDATREFAEHDFGATHMMAIADAAGYDKSLAFQYFDSKTGLYTAVVESVVHEATPRKLAAELARLLGDPMTSRDPRRLTDLLLTLIRGNFEALQHHSAARRLLTSEAAAGWRSLQGAWHLSFTDFGLYSPILALVSPLMSTAGASNHQRLLHCFFRRYLTGSPAPLFPPATKPFPQATLRIGGS